TDYGRVILAISAFNTERDMFASRSSFGEIGDVIRRLIQEALLRGLIAQRRIEDIRHPSAFFTKVIRDTVIDYCRHKRAVVRCLNVSDHRSRFLLFESRPNA